MTAPQTLRRDLEWEPVAIPSGIHGSSPVPDASHLQQMTHWALFRGRFALRAPLFTTAQLLSDVGDETPQEIDAILAFRYHVGKCYAVGFRGGSVNKTYLYRLKPDGTPEGGGPTAAPIATIWTGSTIAQVTLTSFEGGSAASGTQRLYIADYGQTYISRYWNSTGSTINDVEEDFNDDGTKEDLAFPIIFSYSDHLFGTDFLQSGVLRAGLIRFSQPGLIPALEPGVTNNPSREWWNSDRRQIGSRGNKITCAADAGPVKILFKRQETHSFKGFDASSWVRRTVDPHVGAVGPHAADGLPNGRCLVWSDTGPYLVNDSGVLNIGDQIRRRIQGVTFSERTSVAYSPDDKLCYVIVSVDGGFPSTRYAWDVEAERWVDEGTWLRNGAVLLRAVDLRAIQDDVLPGPAAAPSSLVISTVSDVALSASWVNGDTTINAVTDIHSSTVSPLTPAPGNLLDVVSSGVVSYDALGLTPETTYYFKVLHRRNGQASAASSEASAKTAVARPSAMTAVAIANGVRVGVTNNSSTADLVFERKTGAGPFVVVATLASQTTGAKTYNDTSATCGLEYTYRVKAAKATFQDSPYTGEASAVACNVNPTLTSAAHLATISVECPGAPNVVVSWVGTNFKPTDTAKIYLNDNGAGFVLIATVPLQNGSYQDTWPRRSGLTGRTLQYKVEAWDGGTVLTSSANTTQSNELVNSVVCVMV